MGQGRVKDVLELGGDLCPSVLAPPPPSLLSVAHPSPSFPQAHTDSLNTLVALHQLYQYTQKYYDEVGSCHSVPGPGVGAQCRPPTAGALTRLVPPQIISALEADPAAQKMQLAFRLHQIAAALENKVTDL